MNRNEYLTDRLLRRHSHKSGYGTSLLNGACRSPVPCKRCRGPDRRDGSRPSAENGPQAAVVARISTPNVQDPAAGVAASRNSTRLPKGSRNSKLEARNAGAVDRFDAPGRQAACAPGLEVFHQVRDVRFRGRSIDARLDANVQLQISSGQPQPAAPAQAQAGLVHFLKARDAAVKSPGFVFLANWARDLNVMNAENHAALPLLCFRGISESLSPHGRGQGEE